MTPRRYFAALILMYVVLIVALGVTSCANQSQMNEWNTKVDESSLAIEVALSKIEGLEAEVRAIDINDPTAEEAMATFAAMIESESKKAKQFMEILKTATTEIKDAEDGFDVATGLMGAAGGFFPAALLTIPFIRRAQAGYNALKAKALEAETHFDGVVASMAAGGGPKDAIKARKHMLTIAGLKDRVTDQRIEIGDKERKIVKTI